MGVKECYTCKDTKPFGDFCKHKDRPNGVTNTCKLCKNRVRRDDYSTWDADSLEARQAQRSIIDKKAEHRARRYKHSVEMGKYQKYGITKEYYDDLLTKQNDTCAICDGVSTNGRALSVDHDHDTGKIRGLLCNTCNSTLGMSRDSISRLQKCVEYLKKEGSYEF